MIPADETFDGTWPFAARYSNAAGFKQHYVAEGPEDGEVIVCLHGEPTWGYLYRNFIPALAKDYRVVVPDHMGFGKSETPQDRIYTLETHVQNLEALLDELALNDITFVCQDWGGPMTGAYTIRHPDRVKRVFLMNTVFGYGGAPQMPEKSQWFQWIEKHEEAGTLPGLLGELGTTVLSVMKIIGFQNSAAVDETWIRAYAAPFPDRESCIGAIEFPLDVHYSRFPRVRARGTRDRQPRRGQGQAGAIDLWRGGLRHPPGVRRGRLQQPVSGRSDRSVARGWTLLSGRRASDFGRDDPGIHASAPLTVM